jgi:hypothetical protein
MAISQEELDEMKATLATSSVPSKAEQAKLQKRLADINPEPTRTFGEDLALTGEALARGFAQGGSFGFADELGAELGMADEYLRRTFGSGGVYPQKPVLEALRARYELEREANQREMERLREQRPVTTALGEVGGALAVPIPGAGVVGNVAVRGTRAVATGRALAPLARIARPVARFAEPVAKVAAESALGGAYAGFGEGEGLGGSLQQAAESGLAAGVTAGGLTKATRAAAPALKTFSEEMALRAVGAKAGIQNALRKMNYETAEEARALGARALKYGIVTPGATKDQVFNRATAIIESEGQRIGEVTDPALVKQKKAVFDFVRSARATAKPFEKIDKQKQRAAGPVREFVQDILAQSGEQLPEESFDAARRLKTSAQSVVTWDPATGSMPAKLKRQAVRAFTADFKDQIEEQLGKKAAQKFKDAAQKYSTASDIQKLSREAATSEAQSRWMGLVGTGLGAAAGTTLGVTQDSAALGLGTLVAVPFLEALARRRGPALSAVTASKVGAFVKKHGPKLERAMEGGRAAKASTHFLLSQRDPEYRRDAEELEKALREAGVTAVP